MRETQLYVSQCALIMTSNARYCQTWTTYCLVEPFFEKFAFALFSI